MLSLFASGLAFAANQEYAKSDIDENKSTIEISFVKATNPNGANFSCKYTENGTPTTFDQNTEYSFTDTGWDGEKFAKLADCFHSAGDYTLDIHLVDKAGNTSDETKSFTVVASTPENVYTELNEDKSMAFADNNDEITLTLVLKDAHGNVVPQSGANAQNPKIYSPTGEFSDDANVGVKFRGGLRVGTQKLPKDKDHAISASSPIKLKALAPSIAEEDVNGNILSRLVPRAINFVITNLKKVKEDGTIDNTSNADNVEITKDLTFKNPFEIKPSVGTLELKKDIGLSIKTEEEVGANASIDLGSGEKNIKSVAGKFCDSDPTIETSPGSSIYPECNSDVNETIQGQNFTSLPETNSFTKFLGRSASDIIGKNSVAFITKIAYEFGGKIISYPAGAIGGIFDGISSPSEIIGLNSNSITTRFIGADIEGLASVDKDKSIIGIEGDNLILNIGLNSNKTDIYEDIVKNGFSLSRAYENPITSDQGGADLSSLFLNKDVIVVKNTNFTISGQLPEKQKTLILIDGNLIIDDDLYYNDTANDSFGVIILRTNAGEYPNVGNIFVKSNVHKIAGSYFADGGFMNNDGDSISTGNKAESHYQLLLEGALLSRNTLGGSLRTSAFYTPWGTTTDSSVSKRYDLHYVRRYYCAEANNNCTGSGEEKVPDEAKNTAAFIIRPDQKVNVLPPPGFKIQ